MHVFVYKYMGLRGLISGRGGALVMNSSLRYSIRFISECVLIYCQLHCALTFDTIGPWSYVRELFDVVSSDAARQ